MHDIDHTYVSLLVDVGNLSGFREIRELDWTPAWCLKSAPLLDKLLLAVVESSNLRERLSAFASFMDQCPQALRRLALGSVEDPIKMRLLRQLLLFYYKAQIPHDSTTVDAAFAAFVSVNREVAAFPFRETPLLREAKRHVQSVLYGIKWKDILCSHGPGSSTTDKYRWETRFGSLEQVYPSFPYMLLNQEHCGEMPDEVTDHIVAKVVAVPKDSRGPRLVCVHPAEAIWIQQGTRRLLETAIMRRRDLSQGRPWPHGRIVFDDQTVNGRVALASSESRKYATLDLKEASDRLSVSVIAYLFGEHYRYVECSRAQYYSIRGKLHPFGSFAPMGNANVFPIQSLVFWAICVASLRLAGCPAGRVFVFGDDIIVPSSFASRVREDLQSIGLVVNSSKSFQHGFFRESCGVDAFKGYNVTPQRWKGPPSAESNVDLQSMSSLAMRLRIAGYEEASCTLYARLRYILGTLGHSLRCTNNANHGGIAEYVFRDSLAWEDAYWHPHLHYWVTPVLRCHQPPSVGGSGWNRVLESIVALERRHSGLDRQELVSRRVCLNRGWTEVA